MYVCMYIYNNDNNTKLIPHIFASLKGAMQITKLCPVICN